MPLVTHLFLNYEVPAGGILLWISAPSALCTIGANKTEKGTFLIVELAFPRKIVVIRRRPRQRKEALGLEAKPCPSLCMPTSGFAFLFVEKGLKVACVGRCPGPPAASGTAPALQSLGEACGIAGRHRPGR